jgi:L-iditol 2-dehydrogenase
LSWVERRPLSQGAQAFEDLHHGRVASAKVVLEPGA